MQQWQAYVDALGLPCRVWRAQDPTASICLRRARTGTKTAC